MQTTSGFAATPVQLGHYEIDPAAATVTFRTRHLFGLAPVRGRFALRSGTVDVTEPVTRSVICAEIDAASFRTGNPMRNRTVRSSRFLDAAAYPAMTFRAERVDGASVDGSLTVRGVTRPVRLVVEQCTAAPGLFTARITTRIDRTEFGITASPGLAGRYLEIDAEVRCVRK